MTRLFDDPHHFTEDMLEGFLDVYRGVVVGVPGGVVRAVETRPGKVAVVVGGGSGHYPAFCGVVGPGFADGAVVGNIFTSPSTEDAYQVAAAVVGDAGLLFSTGNYAGDVMNFTLAQERLTGEGVDTRVVFVTDDIASAPPSQLDKRRGIAGDFVVFKVAGAAADEGYDLDSVERVAQHANDRTRTLGVAFGGCTMPGASTPLFDVPSGLMGVGLGIHGEPGIAEDVLPRAADLAVRLVSSVLVEKPEGSGNRVTAILNGLGTTKYEELFVLWRSVAKLLADHGLEVIEPEVDELVTSLDMAGCSLTLVFLDEELERLWRAPAETPAYRKGQTRAAVTTATRASRAPYGATAPALRCGSEPSRACARVVVSALEVMASAVAEAEDELGRIDAVAGDGDHGRGMVKGVSAAAAAAGEAAEAEAGARSVLAQAGDAWAAKAGGTSGVLWGAALRSIGEALGDDSPESVTGLQVAEALRAGLLAIQNLGKAELGDKTIVDAFEPFVQALLAGVHSGEDLATSWSYATATAEAAARATADLRPRIGRARPLAERSIGTPDAGATSFALCAVAVAVVLRPPR